MNGFTDEIGFDRILETFFNVGFVSAVAVVFFSVMSFVMVIGVTAMFIPMMMLFAFPIIFLLPIMLAFDQ